MAAAAGEQSGVDDVGCRPVATLARIDELNGAGRCGTADQGELEQPSGIFHLGFLEPEAVAFQRTKNSFNSPPQPVKVYDFGGTVGIAGPDRGEQATSRASIMVRHTCAGPSMSELPRGRQIETVPARSATVATPAATSVRDGTTRISVRANSGHA